MLSIMIQDDGLQTLRFLAEHTEIPPSVWNEVGDVVKKSVMTNFESGGRPSSWAKRKWPYPHPTLDKSGALKNSANIDSVTATSIVLSWGRGLPYASAHQFGADFFQTVTPEQRKFFWFKHYQSKTVDKIVEKGKKRRGGASSSRGDSIADKWKYMALASKLHIVIPARPYVMFQDEDVVKIEEILGAYFTGDR